MQYDASSAKVPAVCGSTPAAPPATPPAKLFNVMGTAILRASLMLADLPIVRVDSSCPFCQDVISSTARYANIIPANNAASAGATSPNKYPPAAETNAPDAFINEIIAFTDALSGLLDIPSEAPTAKLSVLLPHARRNAYHIMLRHTYMYVAHAQRDLRKSLVVLPVLVRPPTVGPFSLNCRSLSSRASSKLPIPSGFTNA
eukprot:CAMPEP_0178629510 /NCGR_PEP_ID=MMETSP0698-20121128/9986_1 /TAXON_ID=265572 /ORGANISM="Extubocellulus spinifer, Strain CCMP396" /LENGTH=200 /DNA_ID=CAMNT_0020268817 /DNA_START=114 /DNA_END=716 /DNA_ORIENTATION=-